MSVFKFKTFDVKQNDCAQKVGTDAMVLGAHIEANSPENILDVGTGTGVIALMMAQKFPKATVCGVEISESCSRTAKGNFIRSPFSDRMKLFNVDFKNFEPNQLFDLIVSNPPFFKNSTYSPSQERTNSRHETTLTLGKLIFKANKLMSINATFWLIVPQDRCEEVETIAKQRELKLSERIEVCGVKGKVVRNILVFKKVSDLLKVETSSFTIRNEDGSYTNQYKAKTKEFHFNTL